MLEAKKKQKVLRGMEDVLVEQGNGN